MFTNILKKTIKNKRNKRISLDVVAIIGAILILIGGFFLSYNYAESKRLLAYDYMSNVFYKENTNVDDNVEKIVDNSSDTNTINNAENNTQLTDQYIGYLIIPKINLTKGFAALNSKENNVEKNILVIEGSTMPDVEHGNLIFAGHSGSGWKAFFNDLYKLTTNDIAQVTYNNKKYTYKITNIYKQPKTGKIAIYRNYDKTTLTLVTCTNNDDTTQTVYIAELQNVTNN